MTMNLGTTFSAAAVAALLFSPLFAGIAFPVLNGLHHDYRRVA